MTASPAGSRPALHSFTQRTRAWSFGIQPGARSNPLRHSAFSRLLAGTTRVTSWPRLARRSAWIRMARTPPALRRCGQRNVIFTTTPPPPKGERARVRGRSYRHRNLARAPIRSRIQDHVDTVHLARAEGALERRPDLARLGHLDPLTAQGLHHPVEAREGQRGSHGALGAEEGKLGIADLAPAAVIADDHGDRQPEAHRGLDVHAVEPEGPVARKQEHALLGTQELGGDGEGGAHAQAAEGPWIEPLSRSPERDDLGGAAHDVSPVADDGCIGIHDGGDLMAEAVVADRHAV